MIRTQNNDSAPNSSELVDIDTRAAGTVDNGAGSVVACEERVFEEPRIGMEFDSEDAAKKFYNEYARHTGFVMRIDHCRRSEVDKRIISRQLSCNKQGYYTNKKEKFGPLRKQYTKSRQGCNATMLVKVNKSGKWVVTRFVKEHTHPLVVSYRPSHIAPDAKERRIQALTLELKHQDQLCDFYREHLNSFLRDLEEQTDLLSTKIQVVVNNVRDLETENPSKYQKSKQ